VLTVFGSAIRGDAAARDLDVGALFEPGSEVDYPAIPGDLLVLTGANVEPGELLTLTKRFPISFDPAVLLS